MRHRGHQLRIAQRRVHSEARQDAPHYQANQRDADRRRPPAEYGAHHAADRPGEQDPQQQPGHHRAHHFSLLARRGEDRRRRDDILRHGRRHTDQQTDHQQ